jgi:hypothetical protein
MDPEADQSPPAAPLPPATPDDIFADLRDLLLPPGLPAPENPDIQELIRVLNMRQEWFHVDSNLQPGQRLRTDAFRFNARQAYTYILEFIPRIQEVLNDKQAIDIAAYILQFVEKMCNDLEHSNDPEHHIAEHLKTYYTEPTCPLPLLLAKQKRIAD